MTADEKYLSKIRTELEKSVRLFSQAGRTERELYVAEEFLRNLGVPFDDSELAHVADDPPDVRFRQTRFEVKEVMDEGRRRHDEYKARLEAAKAASTLGDLLQRLTPRDITYAEICSRIEQQLHHWTAKYAPVVKAGLDLLFYVNLINVFGYVGELPSRQRWQPYGFRSISFVAGRNSGVLLASELAPEFLRSAEGKVVLRIDR